MIKIEAKLKIKDQGQEKRKMEIYVKVKNNVKVYVKIKVKVNVKIKVKFKVNLKTRPVQCLGPDVSSLGFHLDPGSIEVVSTKLCWTDTDILSEDSRVLLCPT